MKKRYWLGIAISALLLYLMFRSLELVSVAEAFGRANLGLLAPAIALYFGGVAARTLRWAVLLRPVKRLPLHRLFVVVVVGYMANDILPLRAGEGVRAFMLWGKERVEPGATLATIVVERIFDGLVLTGFLVVAGLVLPLDNWLTQVTWAAGAVFVFGIGAALALTLVPGPFLRTAEVVLSLLPGGLRSLGLRLLRTFVDGLATVRSARDMASVALLSVVAWTLEASMYYVLMFSFPFQPLFLAAILGTAVANLGTMVPSSPGYLGTFDLPLSAVLSGTFGVEPSLAAGYTLLVHAALILPVTFLGLFFVWREGLTLGRISSGSREARRSQEEPANRADAAPRHPSV